MQKTNKINTETEKSVQNKRFSRGKVPPLQLQTLKTGGLATPFYTSSHSEIPVYKSEDNLSENPLLKQNQDAFSQMEIENSQIERKIKFGLTRILENEVKSLTVQLCQSQEKVKLMETDLNIKESEVRLGLDVG